MADEQSGPWTEEEMADAKPVPMPNPDQSKYDGYKWIKVKRYVDDPSLSWEERYKRLEEHHMKETTFLIEEVRNLARRLGE